MAVGRVAAPRIATTTPAARPPKMPTKKDLLNVLAAWEFQAHNKPGGVWSTKKPTQLKDANVLKTIVLQTPRKGVMGGPTLTAFVLKGNPFTVVFERRAAVAPPNNHKFFGPVRSDIMPR